MGGFKGNEREILYDQVEGRIEGVRRSFELYVDKRDGIMDNRDY